LLFNPGNFIALLSDIGRRVTVNLHLGNADTAQRIKLRIHFNLSATPFCNAQAVCLLGRDGIADLLVALAGRLDCNGVGGEVGGGERICTGAIFFT